MLCLLVNLLTLLGLTAAAGCWTRQASRNGPLLITLVRHLGQEQNSLQPHLRRVDGGACLALVTTRPNPTLLLVSIKKNTTHVVHDSQDYWQGLRGHLMKKYIGGKDFAVVWWFTLLHYEFERDSPPGRCDGKITHSLLCVIITDLSIGIDFHRFIPSSTYISLNVFERVRPLNVTNNISLLFMYSRCMLCIHLLHS